MLKSKMSTPFGPVLATPLANLICVGIAQVVIEYYSSSVLLVDTCGHVNGLHPLLEPCLEVAAQYSICDEMHGKGK